MNFYRSLGIVFLLLFHFALSAQNNIHQILTSRKDLPAKISDLRGLLDIYQNTSLDTALLCISKMDSLANILGNDSVKCEVLQYQALFESVQNMGKAIEAGYKNLDLAKQSKKKNLIVNAYLLLARLNFFIQKHDKVFYFYSEALTVAKEIKNKSLVIEVLANGQEYYYHVKKFAQSKAILFEEAALSPSITSTSDYNYKLGLLYEKVDQIDSAKYFLMKGVSFAEAEKDTLRISNFYSAIGHIEQSKKNIDEAIKWYTKSYDIFSSTGNSQLITGTAWSLAKCYFTKKDYVSAKKLLTEIITINEKRDFKIDLIGNYKFLSEINAKLGEYQQAYENSLKSYDLFKLTNSSESSNKLASIEEEYAKKEKQKEIEIINKEKEAATKVRNISLFALAVAIILITVVVASLLKIYRSRKIISQQKKETEKQKHTIEEKQKEILDSIRYAKRIQTALIPNEKYISSLLTRLKHS